MTTVRFIQHDGTEQEIDAADGDSVMRAANNHGVPGILADCGGSMTCSTCHVYVLKDWYDKLDPPGEIEESILELAVEPTSESRLSCQIIVKPELDGLTVRVPKDQF